MTYFVYKTIKGRRYLYWQRSYRVGKKVKTEGGSLGHVPWEVNATCGFEAMRQYQEAKDAYLAEKEKGSKAEPTLRDEAGQHSTAPQGSGGTGTAESGQP